MFVRFDYIGGIVRCYVRFGYYLSFVGLDLIDCDNIDYVGKWD